LRVARWLDGLYPQDTFNLITFSGDTDILFPQPVPATPANVAMAQLFLQSRSGAGGTEMMKAIRAALEPSVETGRVRIVCFMTDGEVGNDLDILAEVQRHPGARVFAFGIGQSVNRFLLDGMAEFGRGEVEYVGLKDDGSAAARRFHERIRNPLLTDISIDWGGLAVTDVYPRRIPDLFGAKPVIVTGRFSGPTHGMAELRGRVAGFETTRRIAVEFPAAEPKHDILAGLWARNCVADLMSQDYSGMQRGTLRDDLRKEITQVGLDYQLSTPFTSFVAVEERVVTSGGQTRRVEVPVNMPEGLSYQGTFGKGAGIGAGSGGGIGPAIQFSAPGVVGGVAGGVAGGVLGGIAGAAPPPPAMARAPKAGLMITGSVGDGRTAKVDPALVALTKTAGQTTKVEVQILLRDATAATMDRLKQIGFEVLQPAGKDLLIVGRIAAGKLMELAAVDAVRYVVPHK